MENQRPVPDSGLVPGQGRLTHWAWKREKGWRKISRRKRLQGPLEAERERRDEGILGGRSEWEKVKR